VYDLVDTTLLVLRRGSRVAAIALLLVVATTMAPWVVLAAMGIAPLLVALAFLAGYLLFVPSTLAISLAAYARAVEEPPRLLATLRRAAELVFWLAPTALYALVPATFIPVGVFYAFRVLSHEKIPGAEGVFAPFAPIMIPVGLGVWMRYVIVPASVIALENRSWPRASERAGALCRKRPFVLGVASSTPLLLLLAVIPTGPSQEAIHAVFSVQGVAVLRAIFGVAALLGALLLTGALGVAGCRVASPEE
jgi:hypothetical protein